MTDETFVYVGCVPPEGNSHRKYTNTYSNSYSSTSGNTYSGAYNNTYGSTLVDFGAGVRAPVTLAQRRLQGDRRI